MVDASERLQVLLTQEATIYRTSDYLTRMHNEAIIMGIPLDDACSLASPSKKRKSLDSASELGSQSTMNSGLPGHGSTDCTRISKHWREKICEWAYQVVDHFDLNREVVSIAMSHLDRYLSAFPSTPDKNLFQLLAMTCLYLSVKLNEYKHLLIPGTRSSMETILQLSRGFFTLEQMQQMEYDVLQRLQWHVHPPTPQLFVKHFLYFLSIEDHCIHDLSQFFVELAAMDYFFVSYKPSEIAVAGILNAIEGTLPGRTHSLPFHRIMVNIATPQIEACRERLSLIYAQANDQQVEDTTNHTPKNIRTTSPVSVMAGTENVDMQYGDDDL